MDNLKEEQTVQIQNNNEEVTHVHDFYGRTTLDFNHYHEFYDATGTQSNVEGGHIHRYSTQTSRAHDHIHTMLDDTSLQLPTFFGHVHQIQGVTSVNNGHSHRYNLYAAIPERPGEQTLDRRSRENQAPVKCWKKATYSRVNLSSGVYSRRNGRQTLHRYSVGLSKQAFLLLTYFFNEKFVFNKTYVNLYIQQ